MGEVAVIEAHPVGIVENRSAPQRLHQLRLVREVKWASLDLIAEGIGATGRISQRAHAMPRRQKPCGNVFPRVAEGTRGHMKFSCRHTLRSVRITARRLSLKEYAGCGRSLRSQPNEHHPMPRH